ncbi:MAG: ribbon-helix-helix domain-containing protein [Candidatus Bathyarchaeia archaeon]
MPRRKELVIWSIPVTKTLDEKVEHLVKDNMHVSKSDLIRDAVRSKLKEIELTSTHAATSNLNSSPNAEV